MKRQVTITVARVACLALVASCGGRAPVRQAAPVRVQDLGLARVTLDAVPNPPAVAFETATPGEQPVIPRYFAGAPPQIPHLIADFLPIRPAENTCADCHAIKTRAPGEPTPVPASHYRDMRHAPDTDRDTVAGARWNCIACHVVRNDAKVLVGNTFSNAANGAKR